MLIIYDNHILDIVSLKTAVILCTCFAFSTYSICLIICDLPCMLRSWLIHVLTAVTPEVPRQGYRATHIRLMPKKDNPHRKRETSATASQGPVTASGSAIRIRILAKPGAKQNTITDIGEEQVGIQIAAPPVDGEANAELVKYLSKLLGVKKSDITLDKGSKSRNKDVLIFGLTVQEVMDKLRKEME
ncbi:hypothetical protein CHS0354_009275 [Potamilus streckersoni]|uniref:Uncharacterized protein n=1 Tax=Potamilus streckersoni TaxID=2493646 RepID=A0AAE0W864_9BIVA|nr:hypothetical protein CHS0354_009275 [Potamilus streckersoni]